MHKLKFIASSGAARAANIALAWFAFVWAVVRACVQAVTGDEAQDFLFYGGPAKPTHWDVGADNHMLNTIGERIFTSVLGLSAFSVRLPSLIGAAIYIYVAYRLCQAISFEWKVRIPLFICLVYNPFIFDFFVAARGYGIADAFLIAAIAVSAAWHLRGGAARELIAATAISSACLGLAFTGSYSVAFVGCTTMLLLLVWAVKARAASAWKLLVAGVIPGLLVVLLLPSWTLLHWPPGRIVAGVKRLKETLDSLVFASIWKPNAYLINPLLMPVFDFLSAYILPVTGALALIQFVWILRDRVWRRSAHAGSDKNAHTAWLCALGSLVSAITILAVGEHRLAYRLFRLLMPVSRTGLFFLPLVTLMVGVVAAIPALSRGAAVCRKALIGALCVLSLYYLGCIRLTQFEEWGYQADIKDAYKVLACYNHERNVQDIEVSWYYHAGMNFLRMVSGRETFGPFSYTIPHATGREMYVLESVFEKDFIDSQGLKIVFRGNDTNMVVAVRPDLADGPGAACYVWPAYP